MLRRGRLRTAWMVAVGRAGRVRHRVHRHARAARLLRLRADVPRRRARRPRARARVARRCRRGCSCGPLSVPNHKLVPDSRWILDLPEDRVIPRAEPGAPEARARRRARRDEPLRDLQARLEQRHRLAAHPGAAGRLAPDPHGRLLRGVCALLGVVAAPTNVNGGAGRMRDQADGSTTPAPPPPYPAAVRRRPRRRRARRPRPAPVGRPPRAAVRVQRRRERALRAAGDRHVRALAEPAVLRQPAGLHVPAARGVLGPLGARDGGRRRVRGRSRDGVRARARARRAARRGRRRADSRGPARGCSTAASASSPARCWPSRSCPCTTRTSRSTTSRRSRRCA